MAGQIESTNNVEYEMALIANRSILSGWQHLLGKRQAEEGPLLMNLNHFIIVMI